jgi:hypothetical protein
MRQRVSFTSLRRSRILLLVTGVFLLLACPIEAAADRFAFTVQVTLSNRAAAKLVQASEGIIVSASYAGNPIPTAAMHADEIGQIDLGTENVEAPRKAGIVRVTGRNIAQDHLAWIKGPVLLNVNVYTARHSGPDNILACDFFDGKLEDAMRKPVALHCSLIVENVGTKHVF